MTVAAAAAHRAARSSPWRRAAAAFLIVMAWSLLPAAALAGGGEVKLAIAPVGQPGAWFDVAMQRGERRTFSVEMANPGVARTAARTYAADVYSIINGGFGGRLREAPPTGMTQWLNYRTEVIDLEPGARVIRSFTVTVPRDALQGEHIASIVLENDEPIRGTGDVAIDEVRRQAVAVVVTVPGRRAPLVTIGAAQHLVVAGRSTISIAVANPGNVRLKPVVRLALFDASAAEVSHATVTMDTVYSWTDTSIEVPLAALLLPGRYTIRLSVDDAAQGAHAEVAALALTVEATPAVAPAGAGGPGLTPVDQAAVPAADDLPTWALWLGLACLLVVAAGVGLVARRRAG